MRVWSVAVLALMILAPAWAPQAAAITCAPPPSDRERVTVEATRALPTKDGSVLLSFDLKGGSEAPTHAQLRVPSWVTVHESPNATLAYNAEGRANAAWTVRVGQEGRWAAKVTFEDAASPHVSAGALFRTTSDGTSVAGTPQNPDTPPAWTPANVEARIDDGSYWFTADGPAPPEGVLYGANASPSSTCGSGGLVLFYPKDGRLKGSLHQWMGPYAAELRFWAKHEYAGPFGTQFGLPAFGPCLSVSPAEDGRVDTGPCQATPGNPSPGAPPVEKQARESPAALAAIFPALALAAWFRPRARRPYPRGNA